MRDKVYRQRSKRTSSFFLEVYRQRSKRTLSFFLEVYDALLLHIVHFFC